jgi:hypothetical protein
VKICEQYMDKYKLDVNFTFGKTLVTTMSGNCLCLVNKPNYYRDLRFKSLLDHELGTHFLRGENHRNMDDQYREVIKKNRIGWQLATEEGLASISNHIHYTKCDLFYIPALLYYAVCKAMEHSFWDTFKSLQKYISDFDDCWVQTMRVKRGQTDTSKPGGFCKDQATFDGMLRILENRNKIDFPALFAGKVSLETYFACENELKLASKDEGYVCPP